MPYRLRTGICGNVRSVANEAAVWLELRVEWPGGKTSRVPPPGGGGRGGGCGWCSRDYEVSGWSGEEWLAAKEQG